MLEYVLPRLLACVPPSLRRAIIGPANKPHRIATLAHNFLNRLPPSKFHVFECKGPLEGYRMCVDWTHFRSLLYGTWESNVLRAVTETLKPGMKVADIGAHVGYYTLLFAKCVGPLGRVVAFEPLPENFAFLQKNIQLNDLENVQFVPQVVFSRNGEITLSVPVGLIDSGQASVSRDHGGEKLRVQAVTLDSFCASSGFQPDFLKMDVEGAEYEVLIGGQEVITQFRPRILIELHHFDGDLAAHPVPGLLAKWAFKIEWVDRWEMTSHILATPRS